jgi:hypothetical protein
MLYWRLVKRHGVRQLLKYIWYIMARIVIGTLLCIWGSLMFLPAISPPKETDIPRTFAFIVPLIFIIPGIILIYFGRKTQNIKKNQIDSKYIQTGTVREVTKMETTKASDMILYPTIQKHRKVKTYSREEIRRLTTEIITFTDSIPSKIGEQEVRFAKLIKYGYDFVSDIESAIRSSIQIGNPEHIYVNAGQLCEAIGEMKSAKAFTFLTNLLTSETDSQEYKYIRVGAILGLKHLGNKRAIPLLRDLKDPFIPETIINEAIQVIELKSIPKERPVARKSYLTHKPTDNEYGKCPICGMERKLIEAKTRTDNYQYFEKHIYQIDYFCPRCFDSNDYMKGWLVDENKNEIRYYEES